MRIDLSLAVVMLGAVGAVASAGPVFEPYVLWPTGVEPSGLGIGDVDNDGDPDLATAHPNTNSVAVLLNDGAGGFSGPASFSISTGALRVFLADLNADGFADLIAPASNGRSVTVRLNDTAGAFGASQTYQLTASSKIVNSIVFGDVDGDTDVDILIASYEILASSAAGTQVSLLKNNGLGGFGAPVVPYFTNSNPAGLALGDMDGDSDLDLIVACRNIGSVFAGGVVGSANLGPSGFNSSIGFQGNPATHVHIGDIDGDTVPDVCAMQGLSRPRFLRNTGGMAFAASVDIAPLATRGVDFGLGDLNGDGSIDCVTGDESNAVNRRSKIAFQINGGTGVFLFPMTAPLPDPAPGEGVTHLSALSIADVNGDSYVDVLVTLPDHDAVWVVLNKGPQPPSDLCLADIDRNFQVDVRDFNFFANQFGATVPPYYFGDIDGNGVVDIGDFSILAADFGRSCP